MILAVAMDRLCPSYAAFITKDGHFQLDQNPTPNPKLLTACAFLLETKSYPIWAGISNTP